MKKQRLQGSGQRARGGRRILATPVVRSMTEFDPVTPRAKQDGDEPEKPVEALSEDLIRMIKAAYQ